MGRNKLPMKKIENRSHRHATFSKRRSGLVKKARELSIMCESEVGVLIFSERGKLSQRFFGTRNMESLIQCYNLSKQRCNTLSRGEIQTSINQDARRLMEEILIDTLLRISNRKELHSFSLTSLQLLEHQLELHQGIIKARKDKVIDQEQVNLQCQGQQLQGGKDVFLKMLCEAEASQDMTSTFASDDFGVSCAVTTTVPPEEYFNFLQSSVRLVDSSFSGDGSLSTYPSVEHVDGDLSVPVTLVIEEWDSIPLW